MANLRLPPRVSWWANLARQQVTSKLNGQIDGQRFDFNARQDGFITPAHTVNLSLGKLDLNCYLAESTGNQVGLFYGQRKLTSTG